MPGADQKPAAERPRSARSKPDDEDHESETADHVDGIVLTFAAPRKGAATEVSYKREATEGRAPQRLRPSKWESLGDTFARYQDQGGERDTDMQELHASSPTGKGC